LIIEKKKSMHGGTHSLIWQLRKFSPFIIQKVLQIIMIQDNILFNILGITY